MALQHAVIEIDKKDQCPTLPNSITVQFNPTEYTLSKGAQIAEIAIPGIDSPILQFVRGQTETLSLELFFDTTEQGVGEQAVDVRDQTKWVYQLVKIQPDRHAPPRIRVSWGRGLSFRGIVESVQQKFTLFTPLGIPVRATLTVAFKEYKTLEEQLTELNLKSSDHSKEVVVRRGTTLPLLAYEEYGDAALWREIAEAPDNQEVLQSPTRLTPGTRLRIPAIDVLALGERRSR